MELSKTSLLTLATVSMLAVSFPAFANHTNSMQTQSTILKTETPRLIFSSHFQLEHLKRERILGSSETATVYYRKGVSSFETGKFDKAAQHFRAALRADGSKILDKAAYHYLAIISGKQGDTTRTREYVEAYHSLK